MSKRHLPQRYYNTPTPQREPITVYTLREWCKLRKVSRETARKLNKAGRIKFTRLGERRLGVRSDHDQEYLDSSVVE
jgi:excisionase family DNA binding protein